MESIDLENLELTRELFGQHNNNLDKICDAFQVTINTRGTSLLIDGSAFDVNLKEIFQTRVFKTIKNKAITPRNMAQQQYVKAIRQNDILISIGPAGTGKKSGLIEAKKILTNIRGISLSIFRKMMLYDINLYQIL